MKFNFEKKGRNKYLKILFYIMPIFCMNLEIEHAKSRVGCRLKSYLCDDVVHICVPFLRQVCQYYPKELESKWTFGVFRHRKMTSRQDTPFFALRSLLLTKIIFIILYFADHSKWRGQNEGNAISYLHLSKNINGRP